MCVFPLNRRRCNCLNNLDLGAAMQFRRLAWVMSSVMLVVSAEAVAEASSTRTAEQIVNDVL